MSGLPKINIPDLDLWGKFRQDELKLNLTKIIDEQGRETWILVEEEAK